jgi:hypothetical protein
MASRLPKSSLVALSLTVAVTVMALGGSAFAQHGMPVAVSEAPSTGGSLRNAPDAEATDKIATDAATAEPAADATPAASAPPADEPAADPEEGATEEPSSLQ